MNGCDTCGAQVDPEATRCRYCGQPYSRARLAQLASVPGGEIPPALREVAAGLVSAQSDPVRLAGHLGASLKKIAPGRVSSRRGQIQLRLDNVEYTFETSGHAIVCHRQPVAAGLEVGMRDQLAGDRWPYQLLRDLQAAAGRGQVKAAAIASLAT